MTNVVLDPLRSEAMEAEDEAVLTAWRNGGRARGERASPGAGADLG